MTPELTNADYLQTKAKLSDAFALALQRSGRTLVQANGTSNGSPSGYRSTAAQEK